MSGTGEGTKPSDGLMETVAATMPPSPRRPLVFVDTETTSLRADREPWEIALVRRSFVPMVNGPDRCETTRTVLQVRGSDLRLHEADEQALQVGRFYTRHADYRGRPLTLGEGELVDASIAAGVVERVTRGATLVGANVAFDKETLAGLLHRHYLAPAWHYRMVDVEALAAGHLHSPLRSLRDTAEALGLRVDEAAMHTALGDALLVQAIYDAVYERGAA